MFWRRTGVHEGLGHHRQTGVRDAVLMDVKYKLGVLDDVHPEPKRKAGEKDTWKRMSLHFYLIMSWISFEVIESFASVAYFTIVHGTLHHFQFWWIRCLDQCTFLGMISKLLNCLFAHIAELQKFNYMLCKQQNLIMKSMQINNVWK